MFFSQFQPNFRPANGAYMSKGAREAAWPGDGIEELLANHKLETKALETLAFVPVFCTFDRNPMAEEKRATWPNWVAELGPDFVM